MTKTPAELLEDKKKALVPLLDRCIKNIDEYIEQNWKLTTKQLCISDYREQYSPVWESVVQYYDKYGWKIVEQSDYRNGYDCFIRIKKNEIKSDGTIDDTDGLRNSSN